MNKKENLYQIFLKHQSLTSKEVTNLGFPRIYLTMLEKDQLIFRIGRGVYSINKTTSLNPLSEFQKNNHKIIYSCFSALYLLGFYNYKPDKIQISVPQGYNATRYKNMEVYYNSNTNYGVGSTYINQGKDRILVYNLERSICDIIKNQNRFDKSLYNKLINYYFNSSSINYTKLLEYSKLLKISKKVQNYLSLFKA